MRILVLHKIVPNNLPLTPSVALQLTSGSHAEQDIYLGELEQWNCNHVGLTKQTDAWR